MHELHEALGYMITWGLHHNDSVVHEIMTKVRDGKNSIGDLEFCGCDDCKEALRRIHAEDDEKIRMWDIERRML